MGVINDYFSRQLANLQKKLRKRAVKICLEKHIC